MVGGSVSKAGSMVGVLVVPAILVGRAWVRGGGGVNVGLVKYVLVGGDEWIFVWPGWSDGPLQGKNANVSTQTGQR